MRIIFEQNNCRVEKDDDGRIVVSQKPRTPDGEGKYCFFEWEDFRDVINELFAAIDNLHRDGEADYTVR